MPDTINMRDLAEKYGFAYAMLRSNGELYRLFQNAVKGTWDADRITAAVRNTTWYRTNSESRRNAEALRASDPASYRAQVRATRTRVEMMATEYGARLSTNTLNTLTNNALVGGWDDNQLRQTLGRYIRYTDGRLLGQAGAMEAEWRQYAAQMGVGITDKQVQNWARGATTGTISPQDVLSRIKETAKSKYPGLAQRIDAGETMETISTAYVQSMAEVLERNPETIKFKDSKSIQQALQHRDKETGEPMSLWEFENRLRRTTEWKGTQNAQDTLMEAGRAVLKDFGLVN